MKILEISSAPVNYLGGTEKVVLELSEELSKKHKVTILQTTLYDSKKKQGIEKKGKLKIITCKNDSFMKGFGYSKSFKKTLKKIYKNFDIIHIHGHGRFTSTFTLNFLKDKKPIIYTAHGFFHTSSSEKIKKAYNFLFKKINKKVSFFTALTYLEEREYLSLGISKEKIKIIPNWVDLKKFKKVKKKKYFKNDLPILLYVGRIHKSKGIQYVLESIKNLQINFLIVGRSTRYSKNIKEKIKKEKLEKKVNYLGKVEDKELNKIYSSSDFFILFSEWEGFGLVVLEAMSFGLPVVVSNKGALPTLISHKENGLIANFPEIEDLKEKIKLIMKDKKLKIKIKKNSLEFVKKFESKKIIKQYEELYEKAIKK